jgi:hypothetical protein
MNPKSEARNLKSDFILSLTNLPSGRRESHGILKLADGHLDRPYREHLNDRGGIGHARPLLGGSLHQSSACL